MDFTTIFLLQSGLYVVSLVALFANWLNNKDIRETAYWPAAVGVLFLGAVLSVAAETQLTSSTYIGPHLANTLTILAFLVLYSGTLILNGREPLGKITLFSTAVFLTILQAILEQTTRPQTWRPSAVCFTISVICGMIIWQLLMTSHEKSAPRLIMAGLVSLCMYAMGMRASLLLVDALIIKQSPLITRAIPFFIMSLCISGFTIAFVLLTVEKLQAQLRELAERDPLTGLLNRRAFATVIEPQIATARREKQYIGLAQFDLDHFKQVNDRFGHAAGDAVLKLFAKISSRCLRDTDSLARFGGEEFVALLRGTSAETLEKAIDRVRAQFEKTKLELNNNSVGTTTSVGLCVVDAESFEFERHLKEADEALYEAKDAGRNRLVMRFFPSSLPTPQAPSDTTEDA
ncbi:MAG: GGDEF domain-containing protein [Myxococcales bacterium]|nr:GGDEF domain-containing protein [Myxococcales bacterium]